MRSIVSYASLVTVLLTSSASFAAGPSDKSPQTLLAPWTDESVSSKAVERYTNAADLYASCLEEVDKYEAAVAGGKAKSLDLFKAGTTKAKLVDVEEGGRLLVEWGEPAGYDLILRFANLDRRVDKVTHAILVAQTKKVQSLLPAFQKACKKQEKIIAQTRKLIDEGKLDAAEKTFRRPHRVLSAMALWYNYDQRIAAMKEFDLTHNDLTSAVSKANKEDAQKTIVALRDKTRPDLSKLPQDVQAAAKGLASAGEVDFGGKQLNGPKVFMAAAKEWHSLERAALRTAALNWAVFRQNGASPLVDPVVKSYADFREAMIDGFKALVTADAARATEADAAELHAAYVKNIADIASATRDDKLIKGVSESLSKLADKSAILAADTAAYRGATGDWLRWRSRAAETAAKAAGTPATQLPSIEVTRLEQEAPLVVSQVGEELLGKAILATGGLLVTAKEGKPTGGLIRHTFVRVVATPQPIQETLEAELLVSNELTPLTVEAAQALAEAKRGVLVEAGGKITGIELAGLVPFFASKSPDQNAIAPVGALPELVNLGFDIPAKYLLIAADMQPDWVRGRYFFAKVK